MSQRKPLSLVQNIRKSPYVQVRHLVDLVHELQAIDNWDGNKQETGDKWEGNKPETSDSRFAKKGSRNATSGARLHRLFKDVKRNQLTISHPASPSIRIKEISSIEISLLDDKQDNIDKYDAPGFNLLFGVARKIKKVDFYVLAIKEEKDTEEYLIVKTMEDIKLFDEFCRFCTMHHLNTLEELGLCKKTMVVLDEVAMKPGKKVATCTPASGRSVTSESGSEAGLSLSSTRELEMQALSMPGLGYRS